MKTAHFIYTLLQHNLIEKAEVCHYNLLMEGIIKRKSECLPFHIVLEWNLTYRMPITFLTTGITFAKKIDLPDHMEVKEDNRLLLYNPRMNASF